MKRFFTQAVAGILATVSAAAAVTVFWSRPASEPATRGIQYYVYQWGNDWTNAPVTVPGTTATNLTARLETQPGTNYFQITGAWADLPSIEGPPSEVVSYVSPVITVPPPAPATNLNIFAYSPQNANRWTWWVQWEPQGTNTIAYDVLAKGIVTRVAAKNFQIQGLTNDVPAVVSVTAIDRFGQSALPVSMIATHRVKQLAGGVVEYTVQTAPK